MSVLTKKRHIKVTFIGPRKKRVEAIKALKILGFNEVSDSVPWREVFQEFDEDQEPGVCLSGARIKGDMTQAELSSLTGIPQRHISEMENNKRPIGKINAKKLAESLNVDYRLFL